MSFGSCCSVIRSINYAAWITLLFMRFMHRLQNFRVKMRFCSIMCLFFCFASSVSSETIDTVLVKGSGFTLQSAISYTEELAVTRVMEKYARPEAIDINRTKIRYRILDRSSYFLNEFTVISSGLNNDGLHDITAEATVSLDRLLTSLRNLNVDVRMWAPGPDQAIEGRRGAGSRTGRDRFKHGNTD